MITSLNVMIASLITIVMCPWYQEICANYCCAGVHRFA